jgi:hypothetical protein
LTTEDIVLVDAVGILVTKEIPRLMYVVEIVRKFLVQTISPIASRSRQSELASVHTNGFPCTGKTILVAHEIQEDYPIFPGGHGEDPESLFCVCKYD